MTLTQHEAPEAEAAAKMATHMTLAVQLAEVVIRMRQRAADERGAADQQAAAAARAERTARHAADRVTWSRTDDRPWTGKASDADLARTWCAAASWADTDPAAERAARRCEDELERRFPEPMGRYRPMREAGVDRLDAMRAAHQNHAEPTASTTQDNHHTRDERGRRVDETGHTNAADVAAESTPARPSTSDSPSDSTSGPTPESTRKSTQESAGTTSPLVMGSRPGNTPQASRSSASAVNDVIVGTVLDPGGTTPTTRNQNPQVSKTGRSA